MGLRAGLKRFRNEFEREGKEALAYMAMSLSVSSRSRPEHLLASLSRELDDINVVEVNPVKTVGLPPNTHAPTAEEISLLESVDVASQAKEGRR